MKRSLSLAALLFALCAFPAYAILDTNSNGLSDLWETMYNDGELFLTTDFPYGLQDDLDGDGWTNAQEAAAGTNPFDPNPPDGLIRPESEYIPEFWSDVDNDNELELVSAAIRTTWPTIPGKFYTLLYSPDLVDWLPVPNEAFIGSGSIVNYYFTLDEDVKLFWRVAIEDDDSDSDGLTDAEEYELGTDPSKADTSGDGVPDGWLMYFGFDPTEHHGLTLFPNSSKPVVEAYLLGVQMKPSATPDDLDGDSVPNQNDSDPHDSTVNWLKCPMPAWIVRYPDVPISKSLLDVSPLGTTIFTSDGLGMLAFTPKLEKRTITGEHSNFFYTHFFSGVLHGDRVFGQKYLGLDANPQNEWSYFDPSQNTVTSAGVPANNPPDQIWDATNAHVSGLYGGFPVLFGSDPGYFELNENAVSLNNGSNLVKYWTFSEGSYDSGRLIQGTVPNDFSGNRSATLLQVEQNNGQRVTHLVPTRTGVFAATGNGAFSKTNIQVGRPELSWWNQAATKQGWIIESMSNPPVWFNGKWSAMSNHLPRRAADQQVIGIRAPLKCRDTGVMVAKVGYPGESDQYALLHPVQLQVRFPATGETIPWDEYLPGYEFDEPKLDKFQDNKPSTFENLSPTDSNAQQVELVFEGPAIELADSIHLQIIVVTKYMGWSGNAGNATGNDFSFASTGDTTEATVTVTNGRAVIPIYCRDYAAWSDLRLTLMKDSQAIHPDPVALTLPYDTNCDRIADYWQRDEVRRWNLQFRLKKSDVEWVNPDDPTTWASIFGSNGDADAELADSDGPTGPKPPMADKGDGLTAFDEYRGFFLDGGPGATTPKHRRLSVARKELLVECSVENELTSTNKNGTGTNQNGIDGFAVPDAMADVSSFYRDPKRGATIDLYWADDKIVQPGNLVNYKNSDFPNRGGWEWNGSVEYLENTPIQGTITVTGAGVPIRDYLWHKIDQELHDELYGSGLEKLQSVNRNPALGAFVKLLLPTRTGYLQGGLSGQGSAAVVDVNVPRYLGEAIEHSKGKPYGAHAFLAAISDEGISYYKDRLNRHFTSDEFNRLARRVIAHEVGHLIFGFGHAETVSGDTLMDNSPLVLSDGTVIDLSTSKWNDDEVRAINLPGRYSIAQ